MESDERFSHVATDPKFRRIPKSERKVKIDKRFQSMFKDKKFKVKYTTDKRGRPVSHTSNEDLKRYYELSSSSTSESESEESNEVGRYVRAPPEESENEVNREDDKEQSDNQLNVRHKSDKKLPLKVKEKLKDLKVDYARGESHLFSESSSESEESESDESEEILEHAWGELDKDAEQTEEITSRLAVCNMDWDRIRATDLMVLFSSFLPPGGIIQSVTIYPSEFGIKRMQEEEVKGPVELVQNNDENENEEDCEGSKYHMEKLRQYQLNRLKYYYAVVVCDSATTANKIYTECDGLEYESSATKIDLRFIPDDMTFDHEPKETCDKLPEQGKYQPRFFTTTALQQAKVDLTWDETDPNRIEVTQKLINGQTDIVDTDLQAYLASSSDESVSQEEEKSDLEENENKKNPIDKYKALLQDIEKKEEEKKKRDVEMEVTWGIDLKEKTQKLIEEKISKKEEKTPFEQYLEKRKEKRKAKKKKAKQAEDQSENDSDYSLDVDMNDPYFAEEFQNGDFRKKNKDKKMKNTDAEIDETSQQKKAELELLLLNDDEDDKKHFNLKKLQQDNEKKTKKKKNKDEENDTAKEDNFQINVNDERFSALFSSHHFNLDPTDPHFKKTKGMELLIQEKLKRRNNENREPENNKKTKSNNKIGAELNVLIKSVKRKTQMLNKAKP